MEVKNLADAIAISDQPRVVTLPESPYSIVHTNRAWSELTGFKFAEIAHKSNRILQGPATERDDLRKLSDAISSEQNCVVRLINYDREGIPFYNTIECWPLRDAQGVVTHYFAVLSGERLPEGASVPRLQREDFPEPAPMASDDEEEMALAEVKAPLRKKGAGTSNASSDDSAPPSLQGGSTTTSSSITMSSFIAGVASHECSTATASTAAVGSADSEALDASKRRRLGDGHITLAEAVADQSRAIILTEPFAPYAITHVNKPWEEMCGYTHEAVEGLTNAILHGPETDRELLEEMMAQVRQGKAASGRLVNYKKDGERFINDLTIEPIHNDKFELEQFMAILREVPDDAAADDLPAVPEL